MNLRSICLGAIWLAISATLPAQAQVTLTTKDGSLQLSGELVAFDGTSYNIRTGLGFFSIPASSVSCTGPDCPAEDTDGQVVRALGPDILVSTMLHEAVRTYARDESAGVEVSPVDGGANSYVMTSMTGTLMAEFKIAQALPSAAFDALLSNQADVVFTSRRVSNPEVERFLDAGLGDISNAAQERIVAQDGIVAVVSPRNPVRSLTVDQLEGVFSGRITNWADLGGPNLAIRTIAPADGTGESDFFFQTVLDPQFSDFGPSVERVGDVTTIAGLVGGDDAAIGLTSTAHTGGVATIALAGECGLVTEATPFNIKAEDYLLSRRIYAYTSSSPRTPSRAGKFIDMLDGDSGQTIVEKTGFINLAANATSLDGQGRRLGFSLASREQSGELQNLRGFAEQVVQAYRLSTTFRFSSGSSQMDNKAQADAERLADYLARPENRDREVLLIGFTDSIGQSNVNTVLSVRRAQQVLDEIVASSGGRIDAGRIQVLGYGASAPISCNGSEEGRQLNRRVEVWLR